MNINSISGNTLAFSTQPSPNFAADAGSPVAKGVSSSGEFSVNRSDNASVVGAKTDTTTTPFIKNSDENNSSKKPDRAMSHMVETYNIHGKARIKFLDSHNNVIYQIPSEMVAKTEDLMRNTAASANTKA